MSAEQIKEKILELTEAYYKEKFKENDYAEGERVNYAERVFDENEMVNLVDSSLEFWLTSGRYTKKFETDLAVYLDVKYCSLVNSGSSANLLAFAALTSPLLHDRRIKKGDEVITVAAGFPTTITPIIQYGVIPVFVDVSLPTYNIEIDKLSEALSPKTKAVMIAHTLGNPFCLAEVKKFCEQNHLWLIEDNCDSLGSQYFYEGEWRMTGTIGDIGTSSFYPPHHMTMGEGGAVYTNHPLLHKIIRSFRDWGRECFCDSGQDNRCGHRFDGQYGELPAGYDHKYVYSHFGYNLKATDMQAAIGCAQIAKLDEFTSLRRKHWNYLRDKLGKCSDIFVLPEAEANSKPSWFGFLLTVKEQAGFTRDMLTSYLEEHNIQTRNLFSGNIIKHPCFDEMRERGEGYRIVGGLEHTEIIMNQSFWIGVYPKMTYKKMDYMIKKIEEFISKYKA